MSLVETGEDRVKKIAHDSHTAIDSVQSRMYAAINGILRPRTGGQIGAAAKMSGCGLGANVAVAHPWECNDDARFLGVALNLVSQGRHVPFKRIQRAVSITPNLIQELLMTQNPITVARQISEKPVFGGPHLDRFSPATGVMGQPVQLDHGVLVLRGEFTGWFGAVDHGPDPGQAISRQAKQSIQLGRSYLMSLESVPYISIETLDTRVNRR